LDNRIGQPLKLVGTEISKHRVHLQDDRKFGLRAHFNAPAKKCLEPSTIRIA
jgi:hypothetical protein